MRANRKICAAMAVAALAISGATAAPALAQDPSDVPDPDPQPFKIFANVESNGELLPICLNVVRVTVFGTTVLDIPQTCIGG